MMRLKPLSYLNAILSFVLHGSFVRQIYEIMSVKLCFSK